MERVDLTGYWAPMARDRARYPCFVVQRDVVEAFMQAPSIYRYRIFVYATPGDDPVPLPFATDASSRVDADDMAWQGARIAALQALRST